MKIKFLRINMLALLMLIIISLSPVTSYAKSYTNFVYARIETSGVYLYRSANSSNLENAYFELPKSYFVLLVSNIDNEFYKAQYKDVVGYVKKSEVSPVAEKPQKPYPNEVKFWTYSSDGTNVVTSTFESNSPQTVGTVTVMQELDYYGLMIGDEILKDRGYLWLYCKTGNASGYLYAGLCNVSKNFKENDEVVTKIKEPYIDNDDSFLYNLVSLSPALKITLVLLVTLPCFLLVYLLFKPFNIKVNATNKPILKPQENKKRKVRNRTINKIQKIIDDEEL